jgi:protein-disulfide isomerase
MSRLRVPVSDLDHSQGRKDAPLVLVEYGDYQCPACGAAYPVVQRLQDTLQKELRFVFRNFPLAQIHEYAISAARAAEAAAFQGQFWPMHDLLFESQPQFDDDSLLLYAKALGLSVPKFVADADSKAVTDRIVADIEGGARSGVNGTPTFFVNGFRVDGGHSYENLLTALQSALV